jgi:hypothetical protein
MASLMIRVLVLFLLWLAGATHGLAPGIRIVVTVDHQGDGRNTSADDSHLTSRDDTQQGTLWFRVRLFGLNADARGVSLVVDTGGADAGRMNWWSAIGGPGRVRLSSVALTLDD